MLNPKLSIIIPVYNELNTLLEVLRRVQAEPYDKEIIIVDDYSTDGTRKLFNIIDDSNVKIILNDKNKGKGYCIQRAIREITGDIVIIQDADLEYNPQDYGILIEKILQGKADVVYGSRFLGSHRIFLFYHYLGNACINILANFLFNTVLTDFMTGYKVFKAGILKSLNLKAERFGIESEITAEVFRRKCRVYEVPVSYEGRNYEDGKKIKWTDFFVCVYWLIRPLFRRIDNAQEDSLLKMRIMRNNYLWIYTKIKPFLNSPILEIGAGLGSLSRYLSWKGRSLILIDIENNSLSYLKEKFIGNPWVKVFRKDITENIDELKEYNINTVVAVNVLEHIKDDESVLMKINSLLKSGGMLILIVPAHKILFSPFDKRVSHYRRYSMKGLYAKLKAAGFDVEKITHHNFLSAIGWWVNFKLLRKKHMPKLSLWMVDRLIPAISFIERHIPIPFGLSLFAVAKKR